MLELFLRDAPLALIRAAGYIAALIALFTAILIPLLGSHLST